MGFAGDLIVARRQPCYCIAPAEGNDSSASSRPLSRNKAPVGESEASDSHPGTGPSLHGSRGGRRAAVRISRPSSRCRAHAVRRRRSGPGSFCHVAGKPTLRFPAHLRLLSDGDSGGSRQRGHTGCHLDSHFHRGLPAVDESSRSPGWHHDGRGQRGPGRESGGSVGCSRRGGEKASTCRGPGCTLWPTLWEVVRQSQPVP